MTEIFSAMEAKAELDRDIALAHGRYANRMKAISQRKAREGGRERYQRALSLREQGLALKEIGAILGVSKSRASQMVRQAENMKRLHATCDIAKHLPVRAINALCNYFNVGDRSMLTPELVSLANIQLLLALPNCGARTVTEIRSWLQSHNLDLRY